MSRGQESAYECWSFRNLPPKALACERIAHNATDPAVKVAWAEIAIEWHALSNRSAQMENGSGTTFGKTEKNE
jgi:hypothetical protein